MNQGPTLLLCPDSAVSQGLKDFEIQLEDRGEEGIEGSVLNHPNTEVTFITSAHISLAKSGCRRCWNLQSWQDNFQQQLDTKEPSLDKHKKLLASYLLLKCMLNYFFHLPNSDHVQQPTYFFSVSSTHTVKGTFLCATRTVHWVSFHHIWIKTMHYISPSDY